MVCDQPHLKVSVLNKLIKKAQEKPDHIIASSYADTIGTPAIFGNIFFESIREISDDQGARSLFGKFSDQIIKVPFPKGDFDLDTPEDLVKWKNQR